jgi:hypothetical protein
MGRLTEKSRLGKGGSLTMLAAAFSGCGLHFSHGATAAKDSTHDLPHRDEDEQDRKGEGPQ